MAPMPAAVEIVKENDPDGNFSGYKAVLVNKSSQDNPGYPFFIPGVGGRRAPHPPLDFAVENGVTLDGGLPRHLILNVPNPATDVYEKHNAFDFTKELDSAIAVKLPEDGTRGGEGRDDLPREGFPSDRFARRWYRRVPHQR